MMPPHLLTTGRHQAKDAIATLGWYLSRKMVQEIERARRRYKPERRGYYARRNDHISGLAGADKGSWPRSSLIRLAYRAAPNAYLRQCCK